MAPKDPHHLERFDKGVTPAESQGAEDPPIALPFLEYSNRPPPPQSDDAMQAFGQAIAGMALYFALLLAMKAAAMRWRWDIGAICGVWVSLLIFSFGLASWLYGAFNWRGVMVGVFIAALISMFAAPLVLG